MSIIAAGIVSLLTVTAGLPEVMWMGEPSVSGSAASMGMGQCGFMDDSPLGFLNNPSLLGFSKDGLQVELSAGMDLFSEKRTRLVYDTFESSIGESEVAYNRDLGFFPGGAAVSVRGAGGLPSSLAFAAGWRVPALFEYNYDRILRDAAYVKTGEEMLDVSGMQNSFHAAVAFMPSDVFTFGLAGSYVTGSRNVDWRVSYVDPSLDSVWSRREEDISGLSATGSITYAAHDRVLVSGAVEYPMTLSVSPTMEGDPVSWSTLSNDDYDLDRPMKVRLGSIYVPGNILMSRIRGEFYWSDDGSLEYQDESLGLHNSWGISAGVENDLPGGPTARFGFNYRRSPISSSLDRMGFTAGLGFVMNDWNVDLGASFSPDRWRQTQVTGLPSFVSGDSLHVEETETRLMVSISRAFDI